MPTKRHKTKKSGIKSTSERLRLSVFSSNTNIYGQIIDDIKGETVASVSSLKETGDKREQVAKKMGEKIGGEAIKKGVKKVVFDRGNRVYKGRIKAFADGARSAGLEF